ncbi:MAG TPA: WecB/TagA/CpsF family glycosyltransferase [Hyphomonadaceae bacterium]|nr:WecB/TagA/CpsF family glycosyltransferase [Hyphomonadaceae bacterium]
MTRAQFLGLEFDPMGPDAAARLIADRGRNLERFSYVATPNVDHMVRLNKQADLKPLYADAWLNLCDSRILEFLATVSNVALPAAPGADIVELLFRDHIAPDDRVVIVGGAEAMVETLRARFGLERVYWHDAPQNLREDAEARAECVRFIRCHPAPFIFIAVGSPQQEMIAHEVQQAGGARGVGVCCGASLEFLSGASRRAPEWMRTSRLEWLHRLREEPQRMWKRYLVEGPRIFGLWRKWRPGDVDAA